MRVLLKICLIAFGVIVLMPLAALGWLFFYSHGLPDLESLAKFAPDRQSTVTDSCLAPSSIVAIPFESMGKNLQQALGIAEGRESDPGLLLSLYADLSQRRLPPRPSLSYGITRTALCEGTGHRTALNYKLDSLRMSAQLERHFSRRELFTILANRLYFGEGQYGVEAAAQHYFHKEPSQLSVAEAALIAGLPRSPSHLSPRTHPDLALERRNSIIDGLVSQHLITDSEGSMNKSAPITSPTTENPK